MGRMGLIWEGDCGKMGIYHRRFRNLLTLSTSEGSSWLVHSILRNPGRSNDKIIPRGRLCPAAGTSQVLPDYRPVRALPVSPHPGYCMEHNRPAHSCWVTSTIAYYLPTPERGRKINLLVGTWDFRQTQPGYSGDGPPRRTSLRPGALIRSAALKCNPGLKLFLKGIRICHKDEQESMSGCWRTHSCYIMSQIFFPMTEFCYPFVLK